jgi:hypothetical protein
MNGADVQLMSIKNLKTLSVENVKRVTLWALRLELGLIGHNGIDRT